MTVLLDELVPALKTALGLRVSTELPDDLDKVAPLVRLQPQGGGVPEPNVPRFTTPRIQADSFAVGYDATQNLADDVGRALFSFAGRRIGAFSVLKVETVMLPAWIPYVDVNVRQFSSSFQLHVLSHS